MKISRRDLLVGSGAALVNAAVAQGTFRTRDFSVDASEVEVPSLRPEHDGLRVAQLSDVHAGWLTPDGRIIAAVRAINALSPDLVVLTGDYVTDKRDSVTRAAELLAGIEAPTFAVLGNHDYWTDPSGMAAGLRRNGYDVLQNQRTTLRIRNAPLTVFGVDDGRTRRDDVARTWSGAPRNTSRIALAHTPSTARKLPVGDGVLCLSGHTHGGQVLVPKLTGWVLQMTGEPYVRGRYQVDDNVLYVNRGLGLGRGSPVPRWGADPEVTLLTLRTPRR